MSTAKQIGYANSLLDKHEENGTLESVISELKLDLAKDEDITDWFESLTTKSMSEVIDVLKDALEEDE